MPEKPIAEFFDGERAVEVLPPNKNPLKNKVLLSEKNDGVDKKSPLNTPTKEMALKPQTIKERMAEEGWQLLPEDKKIFSRRGRLPAEKIKKYLNAEQNESLEIFDLPGAGKPILAFQNTDDIKAGVLAHFIVARGPFTYAEMILQFRDKRKMDKLAALDEEIKKRQLDADDLLFYHPTFKS